MNRYQITIITGIVYFAGFICVNAENVLQNSTATAQVNTSTDTKQEPVYEMKAETAKLSDKDFKVRRSAVLHLGMLKNPQSINDLLKMLKDGNAEVRRITVDVLSGFSADAAVPSAILELLKKEKDLSVQTGCINVLARMKYKPALAEFQKLVDSSSPVIQAYALSAVGKFNDPATYKLVLSKLEDNAEGIRIEAMRVASELSLDSALPLIRKNLKYPLVAVRREALIALGKIGTKGDITLVKELLNDKDISIRTIAKAVIEQLKNKGKE